MNIYFVFCTFVRTKKLLKELSVYVSRLLYHIRKIGSYQREYRKLNGGSEITNELSKPKFVQVRTGIRV
jgi:hypothetical protein